MQKALNLILVLALSLGTFTLVSGQERSKTGYPFLVNGLRQFPYPYRLVGQQRLGTRVSSEGIMNCGENYTKELQCAGLYIVTKEDEEIYIRVLGNEIQMALFMNEIWPDTGKYKFWYPAILFPRARSKILDGNDYFIHEVDVVGRFFVNFDTRGENPNEVLGYENEVYYR